MKYLYSKLNHYILYVEKNKTNRLSKNLKLMTHTKSGKLIKEIFENPIYTEYKIEENNNSNILISFYTNKLYKYRLDIFKIYEYDKSEYPINHIAFSDYNNQLDSYDYEENLNRHEMIEILNRIHFILNDMVKNKIIYNFFCIGGSKLEEKNKIYEYMLKVLVGKDGFRREKTDIYDTNFALYFEINK